MKKKELGFGIVEILIIIVVIALVGSLAWMAYRNTQGSNPSQPQTQPNQADLGIKIEAWKIQIPKTSQYEIQLAKTHSGPGYGSALDSIDLYLPEFDDKFTCSVVEESEPHKASFATIAQFKKEATLNGPFVPDAVSDAGDKKYAIYPTGRNCYGGETVQKINDFYSKYAKDFKVELIK